MPKLLLPPRKTRREEPAPNRKRWTRRECDFLVQNELLTGRYELIDGVVISKMGQRPPHSFVIMRLNRWLVATFGGEYIRIQLPIDVSESDNEINEPEPDAAVTSASDVDLLTGNPGPEELLLVIEVSDTTLRFDQRTKAALYARAGIAEYWLVDINGRRLIAHRRPEGRRYREILEYAAHETVSLSSRRDAQLRVAEILPPETTLPA
jgi:Uma2 family endonuclease